MEIKKGTKIKVTETCKWERGLWGIDADEKTDILVYEVTRVNKNTYTVKCVEGYMKNTGCKICKEAIGKSYNSYGKKVTYEIIA